MRIPIFDLKKQASRVMLNNDKWKDLYNVISDELNRLNNDKVISKNDYLKLDINNDKEELLEISKSFGYNPKLQLDNSLDFLRREVQSLWFKVGRKSTYDYFNYIFKIVEYKGSIFIMYRNHDKYIRAIDRDISLAELSMADKTLPLTCIVPEYEFEDFVINNLYFDTTDTATFDMDTPFELDKGETFSLTKHLAFEYEINKVNKVDGTLNLIPIINRDFSGWTAINGATITLTQGVSLNDYTTATQIQSSGGTTTDKYHLALSNVNEGEVYSYYLTIKNNGINPVTISFPYRNYVVNSDETIDLVHTNKVLPTYLDSFITFSTENPSEELNVIVINPRIVEDKVYLMTPDHYAYLRDSVNYGRNSSTIPHIGSNISMIMNKNGLYDYYIANKITNYSVPLINLKCAVTSNYSDSAPDNTQFNYITIGTGSSSFPASGTPLGTIPLGTVTYKSPIVVDDIINLGAYKLISTCAECSKVNSYSLAGDGTTYTFDFTLPKTKILPKSLRVNYQANSQLYQINDNGYGIFDGDSVTGIVDYTTGLGQIIFQKNYVIKNELVPLQNIVHNQDGSYTLTYTLAQQNITTNSFSLKYNYGITAGVVGTDNGSGDITGTGIVTGTINYTTGNVAITFGSDFVATKIVELNYSAIKKSIPENNSTIYFSYNLDTIEEITEVKLVNTSNQVVAYATFPPIKCNFREDYISFKFIFDNQ